MAAQTPPSPGRESPGRGSPRRGKPAVARRHRPWRIRYNRRPLAAAGVFVVALILLPAGFGTFSRVIAAWDVSAVAFLLLTWPELVSATPERVRRRARLLGDNRWMLLLLTVGTACVSLVTTALSLRETHGARSDAALLPLGMAACTILLSWGVMHTAFTLHYAHLYYDDAPDGSDRGGFAFPEGTDPDYLDFFYASTVIGMTNQVSDVAVTSREMRRAVTSHAILSFFFNAVVLALTINMIAGSL